MLGHVSTCDGIVNVANYSLTGMLSNICIPLAWPWFVATDCYPHLSADRVIFVGPCTETAIIAQLPCYSWMHMVLSTYVLYSVWYCIYSRLPHNSYLSVDSPEYALLGSMCCESRVKNRFKIP